MVDNDYIDMPLAILWSVTAITFLDHIIYCFHLFKLDWALEKKTGKKSALRLTIIGASTGCIFRIGVDIGMVIIYSGFGQGSEDTIMLFSFISGCTGGGLISFSLFCITLLNIQAMALAEAGIVATRRRWLILLQRYGFFTLFFCTFDIGLILAIVASDTQSFFKSMIFSLAVSKGLFGIFFGYMSYQFRAMAANKTSTSLEQQSITIRCKEIHRFTMVISICMSFVLIAFVLSVTSEFFRGRIGFYLLWASNAMSSIVIYTLIRDLSLLTIRNDDNFTPKVIQRASLLKPTKSQQPTTVPGIAITNKYQQYIGTAPHAPRPAWLPTNGTGQANVESKCWSISLENWVRFVDACIATATWSILCETKGEGNVNMYDINLHFIKPWTNGTGCSIACLMDNNQRPVDLMVSHAWAGSVIESLASIKTITTMYLLPKETRIFFDSVCLYQANDGAIDGLTIPQQLAMKPFTTIIHQKPQHGMFIIHTTISEVYERLWCVHEADEAIEANIEIFGAFDPTSWNDKALKSIVTSFSTSSAECMGQSDKEMLTELINHRGGFERLDIMVTEVRQNSIKDLEAANLFEQLFSMSFSSIHTFDKNEKSLV